MDEADYIIVGGGSAGCVLAHRLSADPRNKVLLIEAGPPSDSFWVRMPVGVMRLMPDRERNWLYMTEPDPTLNGRSVVWHSGRMLGGGSSINGMVYIRGARSDYDKWAADGCTGWSWDDVLPYYLRSEDFDGPASASHGKGGPLSVSHLRVVHPLAEPFLAGCEELGMPRIADYCAGEVDGGFINLATQIGGQRCSAARAFLEPIRNRPNLRILPETLVDRVLFEDGRAVGVRCVTNGTATDIRAAGEVIVSTGSLQSPAVLMRSGIGPAAHLQEHGIAVSVDAPEVGRNLQEHPSFSNMRLVRRPTYNATRDIGRLAREALDYFVRGRGMLTTCPVHAMAHLRSSPELAEPDIKLQFMPLWMDPRREQTKGMRPDPGKDYGVATTINLMSPKSRGTIRLRSADPAARPEIDHKLYDDPSDLARMREGVRITNRIYASQAMAGEVVGPAFPPQPEAADEVIDDYIRNFSQVGYHPVATCRMGGDAASVVDPRLRVRGVSGLRVIDASIMPVMPSCNTNAPAIMIGEKGADMILEDAR